LTLFDFLVVVVRQKETGVSCRINLPYVNKNIDKNSDFCGDHDKLKPWFFSDGFCCN